MRLIDADKLLTYIGDFAINNSHEIDVKILDRMQEIVNHTPTVEQKKGKWISDPGDKLSEWAVCSACWFGTKRIVDDYNYCPNCGARMEKE